MQQNTFSLGIVFEFIKDFLTCLLAIHSLLYLPYCYTGLEKCRGIIWLKVEQFLIGLKGNIPVEDLLSYSYALHIRQTTYFKLLFQLLDEDIKTKAFCLG